MSRALLRRIGQLEKRVDAQRRPIEQALEDLLQGAVAQAAMLAFVIRYGNPAIGEPLSKAIQRVVESVAWQELKERFPLFLERGIFAPRDRLRTRVLGSAVRHAVMSNFPGDDERQKLAAVFASAPPWLIWHCFADYTAMLLGLTLPDLSGVTDFARSQENFDRWWALPQDAFEPKPWPDDGSDKRRLGKVDVERPRNAAIVLDDRMTPRERLRAARRASVQGGFNWPYLIPEERLEQAARNAARDQKVFLEAGNLGRPLNPSEIPPLSSDVIEAALLRASRRD